MAQADRAGKAWLETIEELSFLVREDYLFQLQNQA